MTLTSSRMAFRVAPRWSMSTLPSASSFSKVSSGAALKLCMDRIRAICRIANRLSLSVGVSGTSGSNSPREDRGAVPKLSRSICALISGLNPFSRGPGAGDGFSRTLGAGDT